MPRYFFDTSDGDRSDRDDEGIEFPDHEAARREAIASLPDMARDELPNGRDRRTFSVRVGDDRGAVVYSALLDLVGEWHHKP